MRVIHPFGVGRLMRTITCGLLAAAVLPATALAASPVATAPFAPPPFPNPCFATDLVQITGNVTVYSDVQPDGSLKFYSAYNGSGISLTTGARYAFSDEIHQIVDVSTNTTINFYDYAKLYRQSDGLGTFGTGDDFFLRVYMEVPGATNGGPSTNSLMTIASGDCR
jgi:hypothetical protein